MSRNLSAIFAFIIVSSLVIANAAVAADITTVYLEAAGDVATWPDTPYRWLDIADNEYAVSYQESFSYGEIPEILTVNPSVELSYHNSGDTFRGTLTATGMKPNFAYQMKLVGKPTAVWGSDGDDWSNEKIGYAGRWWRQQPNPGNSNDADYNAHKDDPNYVYQGYLLFDYFVTDENGNATKEFALDSSFHVLWKTSQRTPGANDSSPTSHTVNAYATNPAYDIDYGTTIVDLYAEWEPGRALPGTASLTPGGYNVQFVLTEESFHSSGIGGYWAGAMVHNNVSFAVGSAATLRVINDSSVSSSDDVWRQLKTGRDADFHFEPLSILNRETITSVAICMEHWETGANGGSVDWTVKGVTNSGLPVHTAEQTDVWDVAGIVSHDDLLALSLNIRNSLSKGKKVNIDHIYAEVTWGPSNGAPAQVQGLTVTPASDSQLDLSWDSQSDILYYNVYSRTGSDPYSQLASPTGAAYSHTGLAASTTYDYKVSAVNTSGEGPMSAEVSGTTQPSSGSGSMYVESITFSSKGGKRNRSLRIDVKVVDINANPLAGVEVELDLSLDGGAPWSYTGSTGGDGVVRFTRSNPAAGHYEPTVTNLTLSGYNWDKTKGVESASCDLSSNGKITQAAAPASTGYALLQNIPNPFNPETWIPYVLATPEHVVINIYDVTGRLMRTLDLGQKAEGAYASKAKAAHWDGTNEAGEILVSGIYFYVIKAGDFTSRRKMIIAR